MNLSHSTAIILRSNIMKPTVNRFLRNERGNILIATALLMPAVAWIVGMAIDMGTKDKYQTMVQRAADSAVLAAFTPAKKSWKERQIYAHSFFRRNLTRADNLDSIKTELTGRRHKNQLILTYTVNSKLKNLVFSQVALQDTSVSATSTAVYDLYTGKAPRLVKNFNTGKRQKMNR